MTGFAWSVPIGIESEICCKYERLKEGSEFRKKELWNEGNSGIAISMEKFPLALVLLLEEMIPSPSDAEGRVGVKTSFHENAGCVPRTPRFSFDRNRRGAWPCARYNWDLSSLSNGTYAVVVELGDSSKTCGKGPYYVTFTVEKGAEKSKYLSIEYSITNGGQKILPALYSSGNSHV